ncbi:MAG TPA: hypothetical protein VN915_01810 [Elusimicrobiota bacterium]|nr:hypothetical protein [Elusimicrobiota bacterium]
MRLPLAVLLLAIAAPGARAASLDVAASYKEKALEYRNLDLGAAANNHSFVENNARLGIAVKRIVLDTRGEEDTTLDVGLLLHALGVAGSSAAISVPFDRAAAYYPSTNLTPFIENAYVRVNRLWGEPITMTFGRQSYRLGSGLLLDDDGAGFTGATVRGEFPWAGLKGEAFLFQAKNPQATGASDLTLAGFSLSLPTEGVWQLNQLFERDQTPQLAYGCTFNGVGPNGTDPTQANGCAVSKAFRSFTSARYQISYGPLVFDGEAAKEKGVATPTGPNPAPNHITYSADAEVLRMKWKQSLYHTSGEGIARVSLARGSGDRGDTQTTDEAFYPSHGHRYDGFERSGFGDFYGATPYDAYGGNYSTTTKSGLPQGTSGISVVGAGFTTPAYHGFLIDIDGYLFQGTRAANASGFGSTLGDELDLHLRYPIRDQFTLNVGMAYFKSGQITDPNKSIARRYSFEASGRF